MANPTQIVIFDIGGVLAEVSKLAMRRWLLQKRVRDDCFFDEDFSFLQTGLITTTEFFKKKSAAYNLDLHEVTAMFSTIIDPKVGKLWLSKVKVPYLLFSNINQFHFDVFRREVRLSSFAQRHSKLSYQVGYEKPHVHFFSALTALLRERLPLALYVDDKEENLAQGEKLGLRTAHCACARELGTLLIKHGLI